jgi:hypothetical protein
MDFRRPELVRDWHKAARDIALGLARARYGDPVGGLEAVLNAVPLIKGTPKDTNDARAWTFVANCVLTALLDLMADGRMRSTLTQEELGNAAQPLISALPEHGTLLPVHMINLSLLEALDPVYDQLPELVRQIAPEAAYMRVPRDDGRPFQLIMGSDSTG